MSSGNAGNKAFVSSGFPAAMFVRHQAASSNCNITNKKEVRYFFDKFSVYLSRGLPKNLSVRCIIVTCEVYHQRLDNNIISIKTF